MACFIPCKMTHKARDIAKILIAKVFTKFGIPKDIVNDRDTKFTSKVWAEVFNALGNKLDFSSGDHPQTDGQTKRVNQIMEDMLRSNVTKKQSS